MEKALKDSYVIIVYVPTDDDIEDKRNFGILGIGKTIEDTFSFLKMKKILVMAVQLVKNLLSLICLICVILEKQ